MSGLEKLERKLSRLNIDVIHVILILNLICFAISMVVSARVSEVNPRYEGSPSPAALYLLGGNVPDLIAQGEVWRIFTCGLLHGGLLHLFVNCFVIWQLGRLSQQILGPRRFITLYVLCLAGGAILSALWRGLNPPYSVGIGASTATLGLMGYLIGYLKTTQDPAAVAIRSQLIMWLVINVFIGLSMPVIDNAGHLGGGLTGFGFAYVFTRARMHRAQAFLASTRTAFILVVLVVASMGAAGWDYLAGNGKSFFEDEPLRLFLIEVEDAEEELRRNEREARDRFEDLSRRLRDVEGDDRWSKVKRYVEARIDALQGKDNAEELRRAREAVFGSRRR